MRCARLAVLLFAVATIVGCQDPPPPQAVDITFGEDICGTCDEVIKDRQFAAEYIMAGKVVKKFDDPGCLFRALRNEPDPPSAAYFQHYEKEEWVGEKKVWLVTTPKIKSTHGYNWAAFGSFAEAQDAVASAGGGQILPFEQSKDRIARVMPTAGPTEEATEEPTKEPTAEPAEP